jgi:thiol:disulfide interchange protein
MLLLLVMFLALLATPSTVLAEVAKHVATRLIAESDRPTAGSSVTLAIRMTPEPGWHGYWRNPGDSGMEPSVEWTLPPGASVGPLQYPVPERLVVGGLMNYVFDRPYALLVKLKVPDDLTPGSPLSVRGRLDHLVCTREVCVPESADLTLDLIVGAPGDLRTTRAEFDSFRKALPKPLPAVANFELRDGRFRLAVPLPAAMEDDEPYFYPLTQDALALAADQQVSRTGDKLILQTQAGATQPSSVNGLLRLSDGQAFSLTAQPGFVPPAGSSWTGVLEILAALAGAVLGGLLLNVMPCVFPILSLKALSLAGAGGDGAGARRDALAYTGGAIVICLALGAGLLVLRAGGSAAGWAFQLQNPHVILALLLLVTAIALNLAGLFELPSIGWGGRLASAGGASGAFWTGALAAFVATPCTGPFMAAALGAALLLPWPAALAIFAGLGLGLALPFLLLGFVPTARRKLPTPGPWMIHLRRALSVPMFLTALALAWVLGRQVGVDGMALGLGSALALGLALWWANQRRSVGRNRAWLAPLTAASMALLTAGMTIRPAGEQARASSAPLARAAFDETRLAELRRQQRPVFAYFTADWCITCKVNEKTILQRDDVTRAFAQNKVEILVGDWTNGDVAISRFLEAQGRSGVPLYIYYAPGKPPEILPQVLTAARVISSIQQEN